LKARLPSNSIAIPTGRLSQLGAIKLMKMAIPKLTGTPITIATQRGDQSTDNRHQGTVLIVYGIPLRGIKKAEPEVGEGGPCLFEQHQHDGQHHEQYNCRKRKSGALEDLIPKDAGTLCMQMMLDIFFRR
jgi:hypothetical protein